MVQFHGEELWEATGEVQHRELQEGQDSLPARTSSHTQGMRPYIYSHYVKQTRDVGWAQGGDNVRYVRRKLTYDFLD